MNKSRMLVVMCCTAITAGLLSCGGKSVETPVIVIGTDSLKSEQVMQLDPVPADEGIRLRNVGIRLLCAGGLPETGGDSLTGLFAERLLLISSVEWETEASALLLTAAMKLYHSTQPVSCTSVQQYLDSLRVRLISIIRSPEPAVTIPAMQCDDATIAKREGTVLLLQTVLGVRPELAELITEFVAASEDTVASSATTDMKSMISGLVAKPGTQADSVAQMKTTPSTGMKTLRKRVPPTDNSAAVLRYRDQASIRDSIQKHIPDLRQLYKKSMKSGDSFSGKVVVTIRVNAAGKVIHTTIKATNINNKLFLDPFINYIRTIKFKPVAEKLGAMTFDFPFEFNAEM